MQNKPKNIGIWHPHLKDGDWVFLRSNELDTEGLWSGNASVLSSLKREETKRICFLGESTAAGYFYAPHMTPAKALNQKLSLSSAREDFEVIDLCCVDIDATRLVDLALASMQLNPDILLVFAGNNWPHSMGKRMPTPQEAGARPEPIDAQHLANEYHKASAALAHAVLADLIHITDHFKTELFFVIPETNLIDWQRDTPPPLLPPQAEKQWYSLRSEAASKLSQGEPSSALRTIQTMQKLDLACAPSTWRLKAEAFYQQGLLEEARNAFRQEVDARSWSPLLFTPGITQPITNAIREKAKSSGFGLVDLQAFFQERHPQEIAGNQWFLDYCHLNLHGMDLATQAIAEKLTSSSLDSVATATQTIFDSTPNSVQATANFSAAVYRTHSQQKDLSSPQHGADTLLAQAQALWPETKELVMLYLEGLALLKSTDALSVAFQQLHKIAKGTIASRLYTKNIANKIDPEVSALLCQALHLEGESYTNYIDKLLRLHSPGEEPVNLVEHFFNWDLEQAWANARKSLIHHSYVPESKFTLLSDGTRSYACKIAIRIPPQKTKHATRATILLNEIDFKSLTVDSTWSEHSFILATDLLQKGFNKLSVQWPEPGNIDASWLSKVKVDLQKGLPVVPYSLFGQIAELNVNVIT